MSVVLIDDELVGNLPKIEWYFGVSIIRPNLRMSSLENSKIDNLDSVFLVLLLETQVGNQLRGFLHSCVLSDGNRSYSVPLVHQVNLLPCFVLLISLHYLHIGYRVKLILTPLYKHVRKSVFHLL